MESASTEQAMLAEFQPEFSFMAAAYPRNLDAVSESEVDRCLMWDFRLGLEAERVDSEQACLAVPPGHAIVDTGCTSTLVGSESEKQWSEELSRQTGGNLRPERGPSDVKFEGMVRLRPPVRLSIQSSLAVVMATLRPRSFRERLLSYFPLKHFARCGLSWIVRTTPWRYPGSVSLI